MVGYLDNREIFRRPLEANQQVPLSITIPPEELSAAGSHVFKVNIHQPQRAVTSVEHPIVFAAPEIENAEILPVRHGSREFCLNDEIQMRIRLRAPLEREMQARILFENTGMNQDSGEAFTLPANQQTFMLTVHPHPNRRDLFTEERPSHWIGWLHLVPEGDIRSLRIGEEAIRINNVAIAPLR